MGERPCRYCVAAWGQPTAEESCELDHRDEPHLYDLAEALARVFQGTKTPTAVQIGWFLADAEDVCGDLDEPPARWRVRKLPDSDSYMDQGVVVRLRINDVTYVALEGGKDTRGSLVKLTEFRSWGR